MHKYQGKYQAPRPKRRPFLYLGLGCAAVALIAAAYVGLFFWTGAQRKQASRQTAMEYVTPTAPAQPSPETEPDTEIPAPSETTVPETTAETQPPRFPTVDFAGLWEKNPDVVAWIQIPALEGVDYPVVMGEDNAYYVSHDWQKEESEEGGHFSGLPQPAGFLPAPQYPLRSLHEGRHHVPALGAMGERILPPGQ